MTRRGTAPLRAGRRRWSWCRHGARYPFHHGSDGIGDPELHRRRRTVAAAPWLRTGVGPGLPAVRGARRAVRVGGRRGRRRAGGRATRRSRGRRTARRVPGGRGGRRARRLAGRVRRRRTARRVPGGVVAGGPGVLPRRVRGGRTARCRSTAGVVAVLVPPLVAGARCRCSFRAWGSTRRRPGPTHPGPAPRPPSGRTPPRRAPSPWSCWPTSARRAPSRPCTTRTRWRSSSVPSTRCCAPDRVFEPAPPDGLVPDLRSAGLGAGTVIPRCERFRDTAAWTGPGSEPVAAAAVAAPKANTAAAPATFVENILTEHPATPVFDRRRRRSGVCTDSTKEATTAFSLRQALIAAKSDLAARTSDRPRPGIRAARHPAAPGLPGGHLLCRPQATTRTSSPLKSSAEVIALQLPQDSWPSAAAPDAGAPGPSPGSVPGHRRPRPR